MCVYASVTVCVQGPKRAIDCTYVRYHASKVRDTRTYEYAGRVFKLKEQGGRGKREGGGRGEGAGC
jgi:hypothetical protein